MKYLHEIVKHGNMHKPHSDIVTYDGFYPQLDDIGTVRHYVEFVDQKPYLHIEGSQEDEIMFRKGHIKDFLVIRNDERCEILISTDFEKLIVKTPQNPYDHVQIDSTQAPIPIGTKIQSCYVNGYEPLNVKYENSIFGRYHPDDYQGRWAYVFSCDTTNPNGYSVIIEYIGDDYYRALLDDEVLFLVDDEELYPEIESIDIPVVRRAILEGRVPYVY